MSHHEYRTTTYDRKQLSPGWVHMGWVVSLVRSLAILPMM